MPRTFPVIQGISFGARGHFKFNKNPLPTLCGPQRDSPTGLLATFYRRHFPGRLRGSGPHHARFAATKALRGFQGAQHPPGVLLPARIMAGFPETPDARRTAEIVVLSRKQARKTLSGIHRSGDVLSGRSPVDRDKSRESSPAPIVRLRTWPGEARRRASWPSGAGRGICPDRPGRTPSRRRTSRRPFSPSASGRRRERDASCEP